MPTNNVSAVTAPFESVTERYFRFLGTQYLNDAGEPKQPAKNRYIDVLRRVHAGYRPRWDLNACLAGTQAGFKGRVWLWSDVHLFHANVIEYCQRPFSSAGEMNRALLQNCLARVTAKDILIFGGDITMGGTAETNEMLRQIPAYKINVVGNHDVEKRKLLHLAVDETAACLELEFQGTSLFVSHYPVNESALDAQQLNVHGHTHNKPVHLSLGGGRRHINMSVEHTGYSPVSLGWLLDQRR